MRNRNKSIEQYPTEIEALRQRVKELEGLEHIQGKRSKDRIWQQNEFASTVLESLTHPFYVVDVNDYTVQLANRAAVSGKISDNLTCYALTHHRDEPCEGVEHVCPLEEVKKTGKPVVVEHIHYDKDGNARNVEVHGFPIFDSNGKVIQIIEYCLDITQRKQVEEALRESEQEYRSLFDNMINGYAFCKILLDENNKPVDYVHLKINDAFEKLTELKRENVIGKRVTEAIPGIKEAHPELFDIYGQVALTGEPAKFDIYFKPLLKWFTISVYSPRKGYFVVVFENITEQKRAVEELRQHQINLEDRVKKSTTVLRTSNKQLQYEITKRRRVEKGLKLTKFAVDHAADIMLWIDKDGGLIDVNDSACNSLGYSRKELLVMKLWEIDSYFSEATWRKNWEKVKQNSPDLLESCLRTKDGCIIPIEARAIYMKYDNEEYIFASLRDITIRKEAERALRDSEERYHNIFNTAREGIVVIDMETGDIVDCNPEFTYQSGRPAEVLKKMKIWEIRPPEKVELAKKKFLEIRESGRGSSAQLEFQKPNGEIVYIDFISSKFSVGEHEYSHSLTRDITKQKETETKLQEIFTKEQNLRKQLEEQLNQRTEFTRALVHELNTPLTPLIAATDYLASEIREEPASSFVHNVQMGVNSLKNRIGELLDLSKGDVGILQLKYKEVNPLRMLKEAADYVALEASKNKQTMKVNLPTSLPMVWADEERLRQVTLNLLDNAFKFTRKGGVITLTAYQNNTSLIIEVQDTGRGISQAEQQHLFVPYKQIAIDRPHHGGLGLGLALSKMLVELHDGRLWVQSKKGKGSTFTFSIPIRATIKGKKILI